MGLDDAWQTEMELMDSNVNVLIITMENIVNTKNIVSIKFFNINRTPSFSHILLADRHVSQL